MRYAALIELPMLLGLITFFLFWYIPNMRSQAAFRYTMDQVFYQATSCANQALDRKDYAAVRPCFSYWNGWSEVNNPPELGWHLPWFVWGEVPIK